MNHGDLDIRGNQPSVLHKGWVIASSYIKIDTPIIVVLFQSQTVSPPHNTQIAQEDNET